MSSPPVRPDRPRIVEVAFWVMLGGAVLLVYGGLRTVTLGFDAAREVSPASVSDEQLHGFLSLYRGVGVGCVLAGVALGFLAGRTRGGDGRFRRATIGLALAIVVVVCLFAVFVGFPPLALLAVVPILIAVFLLRRPAASAWFDHKEAH